MRAKRSSSPLVMEVGGLQRGGHVRLPPRIGFVDQILLRSYLTEWIPPPEVASLARSGAAVPSGSRFRSAVPSGSRSRLAAPSQSFPGATSAGISFTGSAA